MPIMVSQAETVTLRVGTYDNVPLSFLGPDQKVKGFLIDILDHIAAKNGWKIIYEHASWTASLKKLESGEIDLLGGIAYTQERDRKYDYTYESVLTEWGQVYIRTGANIESILDLRNKKIAVLMDDQHFFYLKNQMRQFGLESRFIESFQYEDVLGLVDIGKCDAGLVSQFFGFTNAEKYKIKKSSIVLSPQRLYWASLEGKLSPLLNQLDLNLRKLKADENGYYYRSIQKWFGRADKKFMTEQFRWILIAMSSVLLIAIGTIVLFKSQVKNRTIELHKKNQALTQEIENRKKGEKERATLEAKLQRAEKMEAIGTLASGVAHDLNNILSGIVSYPDLLMMDLSPNSPLYPPLKTIKDSGEKAARIVQDLLTLARRGVSNAAPIKLNEVISSYLESPEFKKLHSFHPRIRIETILPQDVLNIKGSTIHISKTIMNLVSNAAEAMPDGGQVTIQTENRYLDTPISGYDDIAEGNYVVLSVSDEGIGITAADQERIFEPFFTKKQMGRSGTGLGMAVVWGTIKDHNGYIDVQSKVGAGTTFNLYFPITKEELLTDNSAVAFENIRGNGQRVMVVDDVREQREITSFMLNKLGYEVSVASSGEKAVQLVGKDRVDLLVLDMIMDPGIDGLETYKRLQEIQPGIKAVIASGFSETQRVREAQSLGAGAYLRKPYTIDQIGLALKAEFEM
jgi:signal transduction histidine kinase